MTIRAIETRYKGYRFRSRLEARWAVFFDTLGLTWEYEKEGFEIDGVRYLPDFWLPDVSLRGYEPHGCWLEIKGARQEGEDYKALVFGLEDEQEKRQGRNIVLFHGLPLEDDQALQCGPWMDCPMLICKCYNRSCGHVKFEFSEGNYMQCDFCGSKADDKHPDLIRALSNSKAARFEHGERP